MLPPAIVTNCRPLPVQAFYEQIVNFTDAPAATDDVVVSFEDIGIEVPRGRFVVEMHLSFMRLIG